MRILAIILIALSGCAVAPSKPTPTTRSLMSFAQPEAVVASGSAVVVPQDVKLQWSPPASPDAEQVSAYNLYYGFDPDFEEAAVVPVGNVTNATLTGLIGGAQYYFAVTDLSLEGFESDRSQPLVYSTKLEIDMTFQFDSPVFGVTLESSPDLTNWKDCTWTDVDGAFRVVPEIAVPQTFYRALGISP